MGKKESPRGANSNMPMDDYRKKIGKQDYKKGKKEMREVKRQAEVKKTSTGLTDMLLMIGAFLAVVAALYLGLYMFLHKEPNEAT